MQESQSQRCLWDYAEEWKQKEERNKDAMLLALRMEQGATSQGVQLAYRNFKKENMILP